MDLDNNMEKNPLLKITTIMRHLHKMGIAVTVIHPTLVVMITSNNNCRRETFLEKERTTLELKELNILIK